MKDEDEERVVIPSFHEYNPISIAHYTGKVIEINYENDTGTIFVNASSNISKYIRFKPSKVLSNKKNETDKQKNEDDKKEEESRMESLSDDENSNDENIDINNDNEYFGVKIKESDIISFDVFNKDIQNIKFDEFGQNHQPEELLPFLSRMGKGDFVALIYQELCVAVSRFMEYNFVKLPKNEQQACIGNLINFYDNTIGSTSSLQVQIWIPILTEEIPDFIKCLNSFLQDEENNTEEWLSEHRDKLKRLSISLFKIRPCEEFINFFSHLKCGNDALDNLNILDAIASACEYDYKYDPTNSIPWNMLPLTPTQNELTGNDLFSEPPLGSEAYFDNLPEIKYKYPYKDTTEYLETNFRLYRTDCFITVSRAVRTAMKSIDRNTKLLRIPLYHNVSITVSPVSYDSKPSFYTSISYLVTCIPGYQCILDKNLNTGNVIAISPGGKFDDVIWAQVVDVDEKSVQLANKELSNTDRVRTLGDVKTKIKFEISLLTEANGGPKREIEIIRTLLFKADHKHTLIVENPVLYRSYSSALDIIKNINPRILPFEDELVYCRHNPDVDPEEVEKLKRLVNEDDLFKTLDDGQRDAFLYFAENRFSIIQGPPGTGKSYLGTRIALALGNTCNYKKVLIMSYKNHSLDEFIFDIDKLLPNKKDYEIVRFGRSPKRDPRVVKHSIEALLHKILNSDEAIKDPNLVALNNARVKINSEINSICKNVSLLCLDLKTSNLSYEQFQSVFGKKETEEFFNRKEFKGIKNTKEKYKEWIKSSKKVFKESLPEEDFDIIDYSFENDADDDLDENYSDSDDSDDKLIEMGRGKKHDYSNPNEKSSSKFMDTRSIKNPGILIQSVSGIRKKIVLDEDASPDECLLYAMCILYKKNIDTLLELLKRYKRVMLIKENLLAERESYIIQNSRYICCTITGGSQFHSIIDRVKPEAIVIEEAAEIPEPALLAALYHTSLKRVVMIGDHEQLRPGMENPDLKKKNLNISCFERLCENGYPYSMLNIQNRMVDPVLWPVEMQYKGKKLVTNTLVNEAKFFANEKEAKAYDFIRERPVYWWANSCPDVRNVNSKSYYNVKDAEMVEILIKNLVASGFEQTSITVLTPYLSQVGYIQSTTRKDFPDVKVATIDSFQGDENKIIILSLVRSHEFTREELEGKMDEANTNYLPFSKTRKEENYIGFMSERNRLIVATSRHKLALYIIGNEITYHEHKDWAEVINKFREKGILSNTLRFTCPYHKVQYDITNDIKGCGHTCGATIPGCQHKCKTSCHFLVSSEIHPPCKELVDVHFDCGHSVSVHCCSRHNVRCNEKKNIVLPCGHEAVVHCMGKVPGQYSEPGPCMEKCKHVYKNCGHECFRSCCHFKYDGIAEHREDDCFICVVKTRPTCIFDAKLDSKSLVTSEQVDLLEKLIPDERFKPIVPCAKRILRQENINVEVSALYTKLINLVAKENGITLPEKYRTVPNVWYFLMLSHILDTKSLDKFFDTFCNIMEGCSIKNFEEYYKLINDGITILERRMWEWTKAQDCFKHLLSDPFETLVSKLSIELGAQDLLSSTEDEDGLRELWGMKKVSGGVASSFDGSFNSPPSNEIKYTSLFDKKYVGRMLMTIRLKDPIFVVLRYCAPRIVMYCAKWESFIAKFVNQEKRINPFLIPRGCENFVSMKKSMFGCIAPMRVRALQAHIMRLVSRAIIKRCSIPNSFDFKIIEEMFLASPDELIIVCRSDGCYRDVYKAMFESIDVYLQKMRSSLTYDFFILRSRNFEKFDEPEEEPLPLCMEGFDESPIDEDWMQLTSLPMREYEKGLFFYREMVKDGIHEFYGEEKDFCKRPILLEPGIPEDKLLDAMFKVLELDCDERIESACLHDKDYTERGFFARADAVTKSIRSFSIDKRGNSSQSNSYNRGKGKGKGKGNKGGGKKGGGKGNDKKDDKKVEKKVEKKVGKNKGKK